MKRFFTLMILAVALTQGSLADTEYSKELEAKAQNGDAFAQAQLGYCYHAGAGTEQDYTKAFEWFKKSAENGNSYSMYYMGRSLLFGEGTEDDQYEAVKWFEKSYAHGYEKAKEMLSQIALPEESFGLKLITLAEEGDVEAQNALGAFLWSQLNMKGIYEIKDNNKAFYWMQKAAEGGNINAIHDLAIFYMRGDGTAKNENEGARYFQIAADKGLKSAQHNLALCYLKGVGVETDNIKALYWLVTAAESGHDQSMLMLGLIYENGEYGVTPDLSIAIDWYNKAARSKSDYAMVRLADFYMQGKGVKKDFWKAVELYGEAQQLGNEYATQEIMRLSGEIRKKFPKYFESVKEKASNGNARSQAILAVYYMGDLPRVYKIDLLDPLKEATKWVLKAADNGYDDLYYLAGEIFETGNLPFVEMGKEQRIKLSYGKKPVQQIDLSKARHYYEMASNSNAENRWVAMYKLGKSYYNGGKLVGDVDYDKCVKYLQPLISYLEDHAPGSTELREVYEIMSKCYRHGRGIAADEDMADSLLKKSAMLGNTQPWEKNIFSSWALR
ncbi:MAG: hypothetical protein K2M83_13760 [Muribaculaceae bacterium]|nr:hypothetical protein [Muribaculaceae bacterium]